ncbi:hypothetical protein PVAND_008290 [Polypedilum vanderplanki]|uniref:Kynurenine 3-monooxygenase n=1 Tax=Polypedilum vanderplanki TaxID=319348 RepID=A0A9J6C9B0_POLVA|nr:hypothetical protein PVAND_008290 [Polypedilum vanderplanki]
MAFTNGFTKHTKQECLDIAIVGGGLVGSLAALHMAKKGHKVSLYEYREDIRTAELVIGRSINLALSVRGRKALKEVGLEDKLLEHGIAMYARMIHNTDGTRNAIPYDRRNHQAIYSVGRKYLNEVLLTAAEKYPNINLNFNKKMVGGKVDKGEVTFIDTTNEEKKNIFADLIIGCDGAFSSVRREMLKRNGFNYSQTYIEHGYLELCIPPAADGGFQMPENYLHIWPRGKFMMIALPNQDRTWTVTLFMPFENFDSIKSSEELLKFFEIYFPDAIPLIGKERLVKDFFKIPAQHLIAVKCRPYHISSKCVLIGDAGHAVVPFYGQGMNAGFEDCSILTELFNKYGSDLEKILTEFSETRWIDAHAVCDLAMYNYIEMRDLVNKKSFLMRKALDDFLHWIAPSYWVPLYSSVSFTCMPYKKCIENREWQDRVLNKIFTVCSFIGVSSCLLGAIHLYNTYNTMEELSFN